MDKKLNDIDTFLKANLDQYVSELTRLCAQPSISARNEGVRECADVVMDILKRHGFRVQKIETPGNPVIVGHADGQSERTILLYNHYDVQPPEPLELWTTPPFEPTVRDGALYARGAEDDKGEFIARLAAIEAVRSVNNGSLPCGVTFVVEGEEESASPNIAGFVRQHKDLLKCDGAIWEGGGIDPDGSPSNVLGYRGILSIELFVRSMNKDAHSGGANLLPSAAWRLIRALESLKGVDEKVRIAGFYDTVQPPSALDLKLADALPDYEELFRGMYGIKEFVLGRTGKDVNRAVFEPTCNIQGITTGYQGEGLKTVIPSEAKAKLDFRLVPDQDPDDIFTKLRAHLDAMGFGDVTATRMGAMWPAKIPPDDPFVRLTAQTGEEVYGLPSRINPMAGGSSPVYAFNKLLGDIPVVTAGTGYWDNHAHAPDEHVRLADFLNGARHIARILEGFAGLPPR